jgi:hypothetical protein
MWNLCEPLDVVFKMFLTHRLLKALRMGPRDLSTWPANESSGMYHEMRFSGASAKQSYMKDFLCVSAYQLLCVAETPHS